MRLPIIDPTRIYSIVSDLIWTDDGDRMVWIIIEDCPLDGIYPISFHETREEAREALDAMFA
jgi:hypothetical protein